MEIINNTNAEKTKLQLRSSNGEDIVQAQDNKYNRKLLDYGKFSILMDVHEASEGKDRPKQLDTGLNHVMSRIATKQEIALGIDLTKLRAHDAGHLGRVLARIRQNLKTMRKAGTNVALKGVREETDVKALLMSLGANSQQASKIIIIN